MSDKNPELDFLSKQVISSDTEVWQYIDHLEEGYFEDYKLFEHHYKKNKEKNIAKNDMEVLNENNTINLLQKIIVHDDTRDYESNFTLVKLQMDDNEFLDACVYYELPEGEKRAYLLFVSIENVKDVEYLVDNRSFIIFSVVKKIKQNENVDNVMLNEILYLPVDYDRNKNVTLDEYLAFETKRLEDRDEMAKRFDKMLLEEKKKIEQEDIEEREKKAQELIEQEEREKELEKMAVQSPQKGSRKKKKNKPKKQSKKEFSETEHSESEYSEPQHSESQHSETEHSEPPKLDSKIERPSVSVDEQEEEEFWEKYLQTQDDEKLAESLSRSPEPLETKIKNILENEELDNTLKVDELLETIDTLEESPTKSEDNEEKITDLLSHLEKEEVKEKIRKPKKKPKESFLPEYDEQKETLQKLEYLIKKNVLNVVIVPIEYGGQTFYFNVVKDSYVHKKITNIPSNDLLPDVVGELYNMSPKDYKILSVYPTNIFNE